MGLLLLLGGLVLLIAGLIGVWNGDWRGMWGAQAYMAVFVMGSWTVDYWYDVVGVYRGDGFGLLAIILVGSIAAAISIAVLVAAGIIHSLRGRSNRALDTEGKSGAA